MSAEAISNAQIAEMLAQKAETSKPPLTKAFHRAARKAFLWSEEAAFLVRQELPLTELAESKAEFLGTVLAVLVPMFFRQKETFEYLVKAAGKK